MTEYVKEFALASDVTVALADDVPVPLGPENHVSAPVALVTALV